MRKKLIHLLLVSSLSSVVSSCSPENTGSATPQASAELEEIIAQELPLLNPDDLTEEEQEDLKQMETLIESFRKTGDVNTRAPKTGITLLHLAAAYKKEELLRCLLLDGADPNAQRLYHNTDGVLVPGDTPLTYAVASGISVNEKDDTDSKLILSIVKRLIDKGARMDKRGIHQALPVEIAGLTGEREDLVLELLKLTPREAVAPPLTKENRGLLLHIATHYAYPRLLEALIELGFHPSMRLYADQLPLITLVNLGQASLEEKQAAIDLLLKHGANINQGDAQGRTPLFNLAMTAQSQTPDSNKEMKIADQIIFHLERGARIDLAAGLDDEYPGFTPYDLLSLRPKLIEELASRGFPLKPPVLTLPTEDTALLATLCRIIQTGADFSTFGEADYKRIASILLEPSDAMLHHELYEPGLKNALSILHQLDSKKTRELLNTLPIWNSPEQKAAAHQCTHVGCTGGSCNHTTHETPHKHTGYTTCSSCGGESHVLRPILESIQSQQDWVISSEKLIYLARTLIQDEQDELAILCLQLLARGADRDEVIAKLLQSDDRILRTGARYAQLTAEGLPLPDENAVRTWLNLRHRSADSDFMKKAVLLTSLEELWFGDMPQEEIDQLLATMEEIGAQKAAAQYRRIIPMLEDPEKLDEIMSEDISWQIELDELIAKYFFDHRLEFKAGQE